MSRLPIVAGLLFVWGAVALSAPPRARRSTPRKASPSPSASPSAPAASPSPSTSAASAVAIADERLKVVRERRAALARELAVLRTQERSLLGDVERLDLEVRVRGEELREVQLGLQRTQAQMDETLREVQRLDAALQRARPQLAAHARALYKLGELSYLRILLEVDRPADMFRGYRFVSTLARQDNERVARFRADLSALREQRQTLETRTEESLALRTRLEQARRNLDADRRRKTELLTSLVGQKELHAAYVQELGVAEDKLRGMLDGLSEGDVPVPLGAFRGVLPWPVSGRVRVGFGRRKDARFDTYTRENGIEIEAPEGEVVRAVHEGVAVFVERFRGYGLMVVLDHGGKHHSLYARLGEAKVTVGQKVAEGDALGTVGASDIEGAGLYFEMRFQGRPEDPSHWLRRP